MTLHLVAADSILAPTMSWTVAILVTDPATRQPEARVLPAPTAHQPGAPTARQPGTLVLPPLTARQPEARVLPALTAHQPEARVLLGLTVSLPMG